MSLRDLIRVGPHWRVLIRPVEYREDRIGYSDLAGIEECVVSLRGWPYPFVRSDRVTRLQRAVECELDSLDHRETWRFQQSGQFVHFFGIREDGWSAEPFAKSTFGDAQSGEALSIDSTIFSFTEIFLFAARLSERFKLGPQVRIELELTGLKGRQLRRFSKDYAPFTFPPTASVNNYLVEAELSTSDLLTSAEALARRELHELWARFGWKQSDEQMRDTQRRLIEQRW